MNPLSTCRLEAIHFYVQVSILDLYIMKCLLRSNPANLNLVLIQVMGKIALKYASTIYGIVLSFTPNE